ncbi:MAG: M55 family metallopeptidase [Armatimonadetes bacterium]|nr:M55 family metallopeptidase [Armatimonadota bacterium]
MKVFISTDIEGITGLVGWSQCEGPGEGYDWPFARRMYTHDVNAAIRGARAGGASEVVVKDSHGSCRNLLIDELEPGTTLISGIGAGQNGMMEGIDASYGASMLVGYHAMAGTPEAVMEHALAGGLHRCWINGVEAGEILASAGVAGAFGVPMVLVTSDVAGCKEAIAAIPGVETYAVKEGIGKFMGSLEHPSETGKGIEAAAKRAVERAKAIKPLVIEGPVTWRIEFHTVNEVDLCCLLPGVNRVNGYTVEFTSPTFLEAHTLAYAVFNMSIRGRASDR